MLTAIVIILLVLLLLFILMRVCGLLAKKGVKPAEQAVLANAVQVGLHVVGASALVPLANLAMQANIENGDGMNDPEILAEQNNEIIVPAPEEVAEQLINFDVSSSHVHETSV